MWHGLHARVGVYLNQSWRCLRLGLINFSMCSPSSEQASCSSGDRLVLGVHSLTCLNRCVKKKQNPRDPRSGSLAGASI